MKKTIVYVVIDGYDYEGDNVVAVFSTEEKAKEHIKNWTKQHKEDYGYDSYEALPSGVKFGTHYRIYEKHIVDEDEFQKPEG